MQKEHLLNILKANKDIRFIKLIFENYNSDNFYEGIIRWLRDNKANEISKYCNDPFNIFYGIRMNENNSICNENYILHLNKPNTDKIFILFVRKLFELSDANDNKLIESKISDILDQHLNFSSIDEISFLYNINDNIREDYPFNFYAFCISLYCIIKYIFVKRINIGVTDYIYSFFENDDNYTHIFHNDLFNCYISLILLIKEQNNCFINLNITTFPDNSDIIENYTYNSKIFSDYYSDIEYLNYDIDRDNYNILFLFLIEKNVSNLKLNLYSYNVDLEVKYLLKFIDELIYKRNTKNLRINDFGLKSLCIRTRKIDINLYNLLIENLAKLNYINGMRLSINFDYNSEDRYEFDIAKIISVSDKYYKSFTGIESLELSGLKILYSKDNQVLLSHVKLCDCEIYDITTILQFENLSRIDINYLNYNQSTILLKNLNKFKKLKSIDLKIIDKINSPDLIIDIINSFKNIDNINLILETDKIFNKEFYEKIIYLMKENRSILYTVTFNIPKNPNIEKLNGYEIEDKDFLQKLENPNNKNFIFTSDTNLKKLSTGIEAILFIIKKIKVLKKGPILRKLFNYLANIKKRICHVNLNSEKKLFNNINYYTK